MTDDKELQRSGAQREQRMLTACGYAAATAFCAVSLGANLQYGLSLGNTPINKATYTVASMAADVFKMAAPLLVLSLRRQRMHALVMAGVVLWLGCVAWSMTSAVGFVLSSRGEVVAVHAAKTATRHGWEAKVERDETQLATLGSHRPSDVIKAELSSAAVPLHIWRRSRQCQDVSLEESRLACAAVLGLRKELAASEAAERLEAQLVAGRAELATASVVGSVADPQASGLARLIGFDEATVRTGIALLLAGLIEVGSALGFTLVSVATGRNPQPATPPHHPPGQSNTARPSGHARSFTNANSRRLRTAQTRHQGAAAGSRARGQCDGSCRLAVASDAPPRRGPRSTPSSERTTNPEWPRALERWVQNRLKAAARGSIPAREAYADFCRWARSAGIEPCTETRFGRFLSARIVQLGGDKMKKRDRAYYQGVMFVLAAEQSAAFQAAA
jgi:hypothetical protein